MALTDAQWAEGLADVVARLIGGTINADQAAAEIAALTADWPTRTLSNADLAQRVSRFQARLNGLILTEGPPPVELGELNTFAYDTVNGALYGPKTVIGWGEPVSLVGPAGPTLELQKTADYVQWRVVGADDWINLIPLADLAGADGHEIEIGVSETHIRTRLGDGEWVDLIPIATLKGADGREVSLRRSGDALQWRLGTGAWVDLIPVADLKGDPGVRGWSPIFAAVADGERRVMRLVDWIGGEGAKPATGKFVGPAGLVDTAAEATDFRGADGSGSGDMIAAQNLNDLTDKAEARVNLGVYSKAEVDQMLSGLVDQAALDQLGTALGQDIVALTQATAQALGEKQSTDARGQANGYAALDANAKVLAAQLPDPPAIPSFATKEEVWAGAAGGKIISPAVAMAAKAPQATNATSGTITIDLNQGRNFGVALTGNVTFANMLNREGKAGESGAITVTNGAAARTFSFGSDWVVANNASPPTAAGAVFEIAWRVLGNGKVRAAFVTGFAS